MAFPGRTPEKRKTSTRTYVYLIGAVALLCWFTWTVVRDVRDPLPPPAKITRGVRSHSQQPGLVTRTADRFGDDIHQILRDDPLKRAPERIYARRTAAYGHQSSVSGTGTGEYYSGR